MAALSLRRTAFVLLEFAPAVLRPPKIKSGVRTGGKLPGMEAHMRRPYRVYIFALSFALCAASNLLGEDPTFTPITFPGATFTQAWGINARGDIVGFYMDVGNVTHGFLLSGGNFTTIDPPRTLTLPQLFPTGSTLAATS